MPVFFIQAANPVVKSVSKPQDPIRILLVPGHDNEVWGAQYGNIKETNMNLVLATQMYNILKKDKRFKVYITRDSSGYTKEFSDYLTLHHTDIVTFEKEAKQKMEANVVSGSFVAKIGAPHQTVKSDIALRLYGFDKWANENNIDAMIHIHFNDYPRSSNWKIGKYKGFTVYIPDGQMLNSKTSSVLGVNIFDQLLTKYQTSTFKPEKGGLIPDQKLIALGANDTLVSSVRSVLIEYGYIYEKVFRNSTTRRAAYKVMADLTTKGIKSYFFP